ncbi:MAG: DUF11 domain-containing protein, partial [Candidatus Bathyarchaeota archaeon]|nr:DUF11 domain-containing protein [Candidatus Bathyarchaeota archaeon]
MRKTLAYFLSLLTLITLGLVVLHPSYRALADWLGPSLGSHIYTLFTLIYLLLADPLRYPLVTVVWVFLGLLIGIIAGKKLGAALTALLVYLTSIPLLAASVAGIYFSLESRGVFYTDEVFELVSLIPVIPEQLTIESFLQIPIFSDLAIQLIETLPTMSENTDPMRLMYQLGMPYLIALVSKPVILIVCAIIGATISSMIFGALESILPNRSKTMAVLLIGLMVVQTIPSAHGINFDDGLYAEVIGGYIEEQNRAVIGEVLLGNQVEFVPLNTPEASDLVASLVFTYNVYDPALLYTLPIEGITDFLSFRNIVPSTFAVNLYLGNDLEAVETKSNTLVSTIESSLGIQLNHLITTPTPHEEDAEATFPEMVAVVYYSENNLEETTSHIVDVFSGEGGFAGHIEEKLSEGDPLGVEFYVSGVIHLEPFEFMLPLPDIPAEYQEEYHALIDNPLSFLAGVQLASEAAEPIGNEYSFDLRDNLGVQSTPSYSDSSDASFIIMARSNTTGVTDLMDPTVHVKTSLPEDSIELNLLTMYLQMLGTFETDAGTPTILDTILTVPELNPPEITLTKTTEQNGDTLTVTVTATNDGDHTITDLELIDSYPVKYGNLITGTGTASWSSLTPGQTQSISYTVSTRNPGSYTDVPAVLYFTSNDFPSATASNINQNIEESPNPVSILGDSYQALTGVLDLVLDGKGDMLGYAIMGFILLVIAFDVI